jgi:hypothetical protein
MQMVDSTVVPLRPNTNNENISILHKIEQGPIHNASGRGFPFEEPLSISKILADFENFNVNDENKPPRTSHTALVGNYNNSNEYFERSNETASLKTKFETTHHKLAGHGTQSSGSSHTSGTFEHSQRSPITSSNPSFDFVQKDTLTWSDYDPPFSEAPPQPQPPTNDFPISIPPLRLPSATVPFQAVDLGTNVHSRLLYSFSQLILDNLFPPKKEHRVFSLPIPTPIGESRKIAPIRRAFSGDYKLPRDKESWKPESDWPTPWSAVPIGNHPRQLTGTTSLGLAFNDQQPCVDVCSCSILC